MNASDFVFEYNGRFVVAQQVPGGYRVSHTDAQCRRTGAVATFGPLSYVAGVRSYKRRSDAVRAARKLIGAA